MQDFSEKSILPLGCAVVVPVLCCANASAIVDLAALIIEQVEVNWSGTNQVNRGRPKVKLKLHRKWIEIVSSG